MNDTTAGGLAPGMTPRMDQLLDALIDELATATGTPGSRYAAAVIILRDTGDPAHDAISAMTSGDKSPQTLMAMIDALAHRFGATVEHGDMSIEPVHWCAPLT